MGEKKKSWGGKEEWGEQEVGTDPAPAPRLSHGPTPFPGAALRVSGRLPGGRGEQCRPQSQKSWNLGAGLLGQSERVRGK